MCDVVFPEPVVASPKVHSYVAVDRAVLPPASKLQVRPEHEDVKLATGGFVVEPPPMKPV